MSTPSLFPEPPPERRVFCNRTLNLRAMPVLGFDMDYTLVHYDVHAWEARAYAHALRRLLADGHPVGALHFAPELFARGLILDLELGNVVKANRFGYVTQATHGTQMLDHAELRRAYDQVWVDLSEPRWVFLNTLFSLSEACIYGQLVDLRDDGVLGAGHDHRTLYALVARAMDAAHLEGELKAEIIAEPTRFVPLDPELPRTLLDLRQAGKRLFLATNSEWHYTRAMMGYAFDRFLPGGDWRELFDLVIAQARKPAFFEGEAPLREIVDDPAAAAPLGGSPPAGRVYLGGNARLVEEHFGVDGSDILYVGDHVYADVHVSSRIRRWRTALVLRELEDEVRHEQEFAHDQATLAALMRDKERCEREQATLRLALQRHEHGEEAPPGAPMPVTAIHERLRGLRSEVDALDQRIAPLAQRSALLGGHRFGPLLRAGNDKSRLARQIERHADVYTSRVSNFLHVTPFGYLRAARGSLPHDPEPLRLPAAD
ncbi:MAG: HAD-IG family 5'-nucleotidase [Planctomycetes bacterium]|nr:HAD-IG family 5'-nucleotidase [Planctomycetota bacterium]